MSGSCPNILEHQTEFEWPNDENHSPGPQTAFVTPTVPRAIRNTAFLRLAVLSSSVLPPHGVLLVDSYDEVSIGRDRCATPRIRLKELAVSKYHANIYWNDYDQLWSIVDTGSTHGTRLVSSSSSNAQASGLVCGSGRNANASTRISPSKSASLPKPLSHLQQIVIGGTTLVVHLHLDRIPCDACTIVGNNLIGLDTRARVAASNSDVKCTEPNGASSLKILRRTLLARPAYSPSGRHDVDPTTHSSSYMDRAELRRQRFPGWREPDVRREVTPARDHTLNQPYRSGARYDLRSANDVPTQYLEAALPIPSTSVGHSILAKQGWSPGSALGGRYEDECGSNALTEPLVLQGTNNRRGLGMSQK